MTIFAVEGPRAAGKTHFTQELSAVTGVPIFKDQRGNDPDQQVRDIFDRFSDQNVILDRFFLTEWVYSTHFNRRNLTQLVQVTREFDARFKSVGGVGIILLPNPRTLRQRVLDRNDGRGFDIDPQLAYDLWWQAWRWSGTFELWYLDSHYPTVAEASKRGYLRCFDCVHSLKTSV